MTKPHVIVYSRPRCHLCDEAKVAIRNAGVSFDEIDIESDPELLTKYKHDIPVVTLNGNEVFRHRVNTAELKRLIQMQL